MQPARAVVLVTACAAMSLGACGGEAKRAPPPLPPSPATVTSKALPAAAGPPFVCSGSWPCRYAGACGEQGGRCVAVSEAECRASQRCQLGGRCSLRGSACVAASESDCSAVCDRFGYCSV